MSSGRVHSLAPPTGGFQGNSAAAVAVVVVDFFFSTCVRATDDPAGSNLLPAHTDWSQHVARPTGAQVRPCSSPGGGAGASGAVG